jgi:hypothetical protein
VYLLYCIFHSGEIQRQASLPGVGGQPVFPVAENGISAAISEIRDAHLAPDVPRVMAYKKVIESFHGDRTVIPMRYGCVLRGRSQVIQLLKRHARRYESLLKELDGCVEMGIRLMIDDCRLSIEGVKNREINPEIRHAQFKTTGKAYLAARKAHYVQEEHITEAKNEIFEQFRAAFTGLFVKCKVETPSIANHQSPMLSLYFLVPGKSIDPFRRVFRHMCCGLKTTKLLLSGPWPPYNFVMPDVEQRGSGRPDEEVKER